jgi:uncharacterized membrane protein YphA (DoxX/SURF4 family)
MTTISPALREKVLPVPRLTPALALRGAVAVVWLLHGLLNKLLHFVPRHQQIVQSMPGLAGARGIIATDVIGLGEVLLAAWILLGILPRTAAAVQTMILLTMNVLELTFARRYLLWPAGLIPVNLLFLTVAWTAAEWSTDAPFYWLKRHPIPIDAFFEHSLVLTYAFPRKVLEPLLPPGLVLDTYGSYGFVAIAIVQTRKLRPSFLPRFLGRDFVLSGYRIFTKLHHDGRTRRGLRILRSDADSGMMVFFGNLLTHYHYRRCRAIVKRKNDQLTVEIRTPDGHADVRVISRLDQEPRLPDGSVFETVQDARRFAGPLPFTFDYEAATDSIVVIKGERKEWEPKLVPVQIEELGYFDQPRFAGVRGILSSAFYVHDIPYRWQRGIRVPLGKGAQP